MPKPASTRSAYKMLTCIYLCRTLLFFAPYADFLVKKAMALLYKLEQHTVELVKLSRRIVELSREMEAKWSQKSV